MKLISTKRSKQEVKADYGAPISASSVKDADRYPYGTCITIDGELYEKLKSTIAGLKVGEEVRIEGVARVKEKMERETMGGDEKRRMELQITDIGVEPKKGKGDRANDRAAELNKPTS